MCLENCQIFFKNSDNKSCFGPKSIFAKFHKKNGLIIVIGRNFEYGATFFYITLRKILKLSIDIKKSFTGRIFDNKKISHSKVTYFVEI